MSSTIKIKRSSVAGKVPTTENITTGELALNIADKRLYTSNGTSSLEIGTNPSSLSVGDGAFSIANGALSFPSADGSVNQSIVTNGAGALSFATRLANVVEDTTPQLGGTLDANGNTIDMGTNTITDTKVGQWDTAYGWGDHGAEGYLTNNQTITLSGDVSGSGTTSITVTVNDDSHNHIISNVDGLQTALDAKASITGSENLTNKTLTSPQITGTIVEDIYALSGTTPALDPANGSIQTWTLSGTSSPTDSVSAGESLILMIDDGSAYSITWPTITWLNNGGVAPTLATTGYTAITIWKVGSTLYGALIADGT